MFNFFYLVIKLLWYGSRVWRVNMVWRVSPVNFVLTCQFFFYLVIKLSQHESKVWWVNLVWRVNLVNSDFFSFSSLIFFFVFFILINLFNYYTFMTQSCSQTHIQDYRVWYCTHTHLNLGHASLMLLLIL
jgi:hypothetical protein